jgi:Mor family transcriptional regulator
MASRDESAIDRLARAHGAEVALAVCQTLGGEIVYLPRVCDFRAAQARAARNDRLRALFDGRNVIQLAERFGLSPRHVRRLLKERSAKKYPLVSAG